MTGEPLFEVLDGGLMTTIQDAGRPGWAHLGIPESGAADPWSLAVANLLVGNDPGRAVLEATITGPTLRAMRPVTIGLGGADLGGRAGGRRLRAGQAHVLAAGETVTLPGGAGRGCRAYVAVEGGFRVPELLGSSSTCLAGAFGGSEGRALRSGDVLHGSAGDGVPRRPCAWPHSDDRPAPPDGGAVATVRVVPGPADGFDSLAAERWRVAPASDRVGTRLDGPPLPAGVGGEATTHGVPWGAIQVPPDGRPIILGPDHQTTGGYRVVGVVIAADRPVLGQLAPGAEVRLLPATRDAAVAALRDQRDALGAGAAAIRDAARWDALVEGAGG